MDHRTNSSPQRHSSVGTQNNTICPNIQNSETLTIADELKKARKEAADLKLANTKLNGEKTILLLAVDRAQSDQRNQNTEFGRLKDLVAELNRKVSRTSRLETEIRMLNFQLTNLEEVIQQKADYTARLETELQEAILHITNLTKRKQRYADRTSRYKAKLQMAEDELLSLKKPHVMKPGPTKRSTVKVEMGQKKVLEDGKRKEKEMAHHLNDRRNLTYSTL